MTTPAPSALSMDRLLADVGRRSTQVFLTSALIQAGTFVVLAAAALLLPTSEFASLSLIVATTVLSGALFDLGLSTTTTRQFGITRDEGVFAMPLAIRLLLVPVAGAVGLLLWQSGLREIGLGVLLGALQNIWVGSRAADQARQDYGSFLRSSIAFATLRLAAGLAVIILRPEPILIAVALYAVPLVAALWSRSSRSLGRLLAARPAWDWGMIRYSAFVYVAALSFVALPYAPQLAMAATHDEASIATYGVILTFAGAINLIFFSLRSVLLPMMLSTGGRLERELWSRRGAVAVGGLFVALVVVALVLATAVQAVYGGKYPDILPSFLISFVGYAATATIGLYSLSVHTRGVPELNAGVSLLRLAALGLISVLVPPSLLAVVCSVAATMVGSELLLALLLARRISR